MNYLFHLLVLVGLAAILAGSLNLVLGLGGMLSLCHAGFYGLGAYGYALLTARAGWPSIPALIVSAGLVALVAFLLAWPCLRMRGDFFMLGTLGIQMIFVVVATNWIDLTGGPYGIGGIARLGLGGWEARSIGAQALVVSGVAAVILLGLARVVTSPFGRSLRATRDDELAAISMGKDTTALRVAAFSFAAAAAAIAGGLHAGYLAFIDPSGFGLDQSIAILTSLVLGGTGNLKGPLIGAVLIVLLPEGLRFLHVSEAASPHVRQIVFGLLLITLMRFRPQGVAGEYKLEG